ncbi:DUF190 domain-containing protein [Methyloceanibacter sp.]|uniref:DUF190 domain-containing protein n=1 Tax=Methyloceanibacter sp. TaxID=1965321 RepID=UPI00351B2683
MDLAGTTVLHGPMGFGHSSVLHNTKILRLSQDLPLIIEIVDSEEKIARLRRGDRADHGQRPDHQASRSSDPLHATGDPATPIKPELSGPGHRARVAPLCTP